VYTGNMESRLKDLGTRCVSKILLASAVQLIARITVSWGVKFQKGRLARKKKICIPRYE